MSAFVEKQFKVHASGSSLRKEIFGGLTTFAAMSYILVVNAGILSATGMNQEGVVVATALSSALGCFLMAWLTNYPIALAPAMGTNAYFANLVVLGMGVPWQAALSITFWNGVIFLLLSLSGIRRRIAEALPKAIQIGIQAGIGFFIALLGLRAAGLVVGSPATMVTFGKVYEIGPALAIIGLLVMAVLVSRRVPGAIIAGIAVISVAAFFIQTGSDPVTKEPIMLASLPESFTVSPGSVGEVFFQLQWLWPFENFAQALPVLFTLLILDLFDSIGTIVGVSRRAGLLNEEGKLPKLSQALTADACATIFGALFGTSTVTSYVESAAGIESGARTGLSTVVVGICFGLAILLAPLLASVPGVATAPALIMVGLFMAEGLRYLDYDDFVETGSAILTALLIPFFFSIAHGIAFGLLFYIVVQTGLGRFKRIPFMTWVTGLIFVLFYAFEYVTDEAAAKRNKEKAAATSVEQVEAELPEAGASIDALPEAKPE
ncbi:MAG: NCS2 family permease [Opitutales bacterium]